MNGCPILYVEDEENDVIFMKLAFKRAGITHPLQTTKDGKEAVDYLAGNGKYADRARFPLPCLVLLDLNLPYLSGLDVLQWMRAQSEFKSLPALLFTASAQESDREKAFQLGANDFITKPSDMSRLPALLRSIRERWLTA